MEQHCIPAKDEKLFPASGFTTTTQEWYQEVSRSRNVMSSDAPQSQMWNLVEVLGAPDMFEEDRDVIEFVDANGLLHSNSVAFKP